jgi:hypothetical protein
MLPATAGAARDAPDTLRDLRRGHPGSALVQLVRRDEDHQWPGGETVIAGPVADQAALYGLLTKIRDLNLPLISLRRLPT